MARAKKPILPKPFRAQAFAQEFLRAADEVNGRMQQLFDRTVATWRDKPDFVQAVGQNNDATVGHVYTTDDVYKFIARGTSVRYATMTRNFVAKTRPNILTSGQGRGGLDYVDRRVPRPGIEARNFEELVAKNKALQQFQRLALRRALARAVKRSGHAI